MDAEPPEDSTNKPHDPYAALRLPGVGLYLVGNVLTILGMQAQTMTVEWEVYERTQSYLALGLIGLVQFLPLVALTLPAGQQADRAGRKLTVMVSMAAVAGCSLGLAWISVAGADVGWIYLCLLASGVARAFLRPAKAALLPEIVPREHFASAVTWNMNGFQLASMIGPAVGGHIVAWFGSAWPVYLLDAGATLASLALLMPVRVPRREIAPTETNLATLLAGLRFVFGHRVILGAIALDMFAVLLGGAVALLPVYAEDILLVGPEGLGWLKTAPAVGALIFSFLLAHRPPIKHSGKTLLWTVAGFGAATIGFGFSRSYSVSLVMLFFTGAFDIVSVVIRHTLVQLLTPDDMRGRVSAVNSVFISASNELGGFESGAVAAWAGPTASVVSGGIGTLAVVVLIGWFWPDLRRYGRLVGEEQPPKH
jgi:MFS family permease